MRTELLAYLSTALTGTITVSNELPFEQGGSAVYLKNKRKVYLDEPQVEQGTLIPVVNGADVMQNITTVSVYLAVDAKNRNADLNSALATLAQARLSATLPTSFRKEFDYTTSIEADTMLYEMQYRFHTIA